MNNPIHALALTLAMFATGMPALAQEDAAAPAAEAAPAETAPVETAPAETRERGVSVVVDVDDDGDDDGAGAIGRALGTGLAAILEEHVLVRDDLSDADREEVQEAIAELRGEIQTETRAAAQEVVSEVRTEVQNEVREAGKEIAAAARDGVKDKRRVIISGDGGSEDDFGFFPALVASLAIVFTLGMPILIVALILYSGYRRRRLAHETINQFVASGKEIPPEIMQNLFKDAGTVQTPRTNLHKGTVNCGIGLGIIVCFYAAGIEFLAAIGFIFLFVGLAQLLIWKLEQGRKGESAQG